MSIFKLFEHAGEDFEHFSDFPRTAPQFPRIFSFSAHLIPAPQTKKPAGQAFPLLFTASKYKSMLAYIYKAVSTDLLINII